MKLKSENVGKVFGNLKVLKALTSSYAGKRQYQVQCLICKEKLIRHKGQLKRGVKCHCGKTSCRQEHYKNKKFGKLTAVNFVTTQNGISIWLFKCDCGNFCEKDINSVRNKRTALHCRDCV